MTGRLFELIVAGFISSAATATLSAQDIERDATATVEQVVELALANPLVGPARDAELRLVRAEIEVRTRRAPPRVEATFEQLAGPDRLGAYEGSVMLQQSFDVSPWRQRLRETVAHRELAADAGLEAWRLAVATAVREAYFAIRYAEERSAVFDDWILQLERGADIVARRAASGDAAEFEVVRFNRELDLARAQRALALAAMAEAWAALEGWVAWTSRPQLTGPLAPTDVRDVDHRSVPREEQLTHLSLALNAETAAWDRSFLRDWTVGAAFRMAGEGRDAVPGFAVSLALPLPVRDGHPAVIESLEAERVRLDAEREMTVSLVEQAELGAGRWLLDVMALLESLPPREQDRELSRLAELAYFGGEATLAELLDAYTSETELQLYRVDLEWEARRAAIARERHRSQGETP